MGERAGSEPKQSAVERIRHGTICLRQGNELAAGDVKI